MSSSLTTSGPHPNAPFGTQARMSPAVALVWKQLADMSQAFAVLTAGSAFVLALTAWLMRDGGMFYAHSYSVVILFTCGFALVACFISFVTEFESRTRDFLSCLPVSSVLVGVVKLFCALLAVAAFLSVQLLLRWAVLSLLSSWFDPHQLHSDFTGTMPVYFVPFFVAVGPHRGCRLSVRCRWHGCCVLRVSATFRLFDRRTIQRLFGGTRLRQKCCF